MNIKNLFKILCVFFLASNMNAQTKKSEKAELNLSLECDHCKICEKCGLNFRDNMLNTKGVKMYELNEEKKTLPVYYTDLPTIRKAISKLGLDADDVKADLEACKKQDGCCKA